jgi:hypothetical protein
VTWARFGLWCRLHPADAPFDPLLGVALGAADVAAIDGVYHGNRRTRCVAIGAPLGQREIRSFDLR